MEDTKARELANRILFTVLETAVNQKKVRDYYPKEDAADVENAFAALVEEMRATLGSPRGSGGSVYATSTSEVFNQEVRTELHKMYQDIQLEFGESSFIDSIRVTVGKVKHQWVISALIFSDEGSPKVVTRTVPVSV